MLDRSKLTTRQLEVYDFMVAWQRKHGLPPTFRQIGIAMAIASPNGVTSHLRKLVEAGFVRHDEASASRGYVAVDDELVQLRARVAQLNEGILHVTMRYGKQMTLDAYQELAGLIQPATTLIEAK